MIADHVECHPLAYDTGKAFDIVRTSLTTSFAAGESVKTVQDRLGHTSAVMTLDVYGHLWPEDEDRTREAVDTAFGAVG